MDMDMNMDISGSKKGYLNNDFRVFHLKDQKNMDFEFHYHEFYKIIIFISGKVTYLIEGKAYELMPYDILFVNRNDIHKSVIAGSQVYERIVLWMNRDFLDSRSSEASSLIRCFDISSEKKAKLMRLNNPDLSNLKALLERMEAASSDTSFGADILTSSLFLELMVYFNRYCMNEENMTVSSGVSFDEAVNAVLDYINENLGEDLSSDALASKFYMSKYHLMHKFKKQTGYSVHSYVLKKRLIKAGMLMKEGYSVGETCVLCGFGDYANFIRAYKKMYGVAPGRHYSGGGI